MVLTPVMPICRLTQTNKLTYLSDSNSTTNSSANADTSDNIEPSAIKSDILYQKTLAQDISSTAPMMSSNLLPSSLTVLSGTSISSVSNHEICSGEKHLTL